MVGDRSDLIPISMDFCIKPDGASWGGLGSLALDGEFYFIFLVENEFHNHMLGIICHSVRGKLLAS